MKDIKEQKKCTVDICPFYGTGSIEESGTRCVTCISYYNYKTPEEKEIENLQQQLLASKQENGELKEKLFNRGQSPLHSAVVKKLEQENEIKDEMIKSMATTILALNIKTKSVEGCIRLHRKIAPQALSQKEERYELEKNSIADKIDPKELNAYGRN